ncbi:DNRLRE domain-containing protein [Actinomadura kijaniata]|uniref:DNRLRE domain-containing protein n=1 Tax=Actinomadura kijaniata TaxID=46161 RepID=UPI00083526D8|nr:DNRLRE domain-containing protein [Actinomadura kijaniata]
MTILTAITCLLGTAVPVSAAPDLSPASTPVGKPARQQHAASELAWAAKYAPGSIAWAITKAKQTRKKVTVPDQTTETALTIANPDGTLTTELTSGPERTWKNGRWQPVDVTLTQGKDGSVAARNHPNGLRLSGKTGQLPGSLRAAQSAPATDLATLGQGSKQITLQWRGGLPQPRLSGTRATYPNAVPGADVIVEATRTGFEQFVRLNTRPGGTYSYTLPVRAPGLKAAQRADGSVAFTDATGTVRAEMPTPRMWDAKIDPASGMPATITTVDLKVADKGNGDIDLTVIPDPKWLADPARRYPVTVDPSTSNLSNLGDISVQRGYARAWSDVDLAFGNHGSKDANDQDRIARSYIKWNTKPIADKLITKATLSLYNIYSGNTDCKPYQWSVWDTAIADGTMTWDNHETKAPWNQQYATSTQTAGNQTTCTQPDAWINADVTNLVQTWASRKTDINSLGLRASETNALAWKRVNSANAATNQPKLTVTHNWRPDEGGNDLKAGPPWRAEGGIWQVYTPEAVLRDTFTDRDGDKVRGSFQVYDTATNKPVAAPQPDGVFLSAFVDPGKPAEVKIPAGTLQDGKTYKFRTSAYDGAHYSTTWSAWQQFVVTVPEPLPTGLPAGLKQLLTDYQNGTLGHDTFAEYGYEKLGADIKDVELPTKYRDTATLSEQQLSMLTGMLTAALAKLPKEKVQALDQAASTPPAGQTRAPKRTAQDPWAGCGTLAAWYMGKIYRCGFSGQHFEVFWNIEGDRAIDDLADADKNLYPDKIERIMDSLEHARNYYITQMGYALPDKTKVYVGHPFVSTEGGFAEPFTSIIGFGTQKLFLGEKAGPFYLLRHELFHAAQFQYISGRSWMLNNVNTQWWMEATAEWASQFTLRADPKSSTTVDRYSYARHIDEFLGRPNDYLDQWDGFGEPRQYGAFLFPEYLSERFGTVVIRHIWEGLDRTLSGQPRSAIEDRLGGLGTSWEKELKTFATANQILCKPSADQDPNDGWRYQNPDIPQWCASYLANAARTKDNVSGLHRPYRSTITLDNSGYASGQVGVNGGGTYYIDLVAPQGMPSRDFQVDLNVQQWPGDIVATLVTWKKIGKRCGPDQPWVKPNRVGLFDVKLGGECTMATLVITNINPRSVGIVDWLTVFKANR